MFNLGGIFVSMKVDKKPFDDTLDHAERRARAFATNWERMAMGLGKAMAGISLGGAAFRGIEAASDRFINYERKLIGLAKASDLTGDALKGLQKEIEDLSVSMVGVKLDDLMAIATMVAKLGTPREQIASMTEGIAKMSIAMDDMPVEEIVVSIGKINNIFGLGAEGVFQLGSAFDKLDDSGDAAASQIMRVTQYAAGTAKAMGISAQDTIAFANAFLRTGTAVEASGTAMNKLFGLLAETDSAQAKPRTTLLNLLGLDDKSFEQARANDPVGLIMKMLEKLKTLPLDDQTNVLRGIGLGTANEAGPLRNLMGGIDIIKESRKQADSEFKSLNQMNNTYATNAESTAAKMEQVYNRQAIALQRLGFVAKDVTGVLAEVNASLLENAAELSEFVTLANFDRESPYNRYKLLEGQKDPGLLARIMGFDGKEVVELDPKVGDEMVKQGKAVYMGKGFGVDSPPALDADLAAQEIAKRRELKKAAEEGHKKLVAAMSGPGEFVGPMPRPAPAGGIGPVGMGAAMAAARNSIFADGKNAQGSLDAVRAARDEFSRREMLAPLGQVFSGADIAAAAQKAVMQGAQQDKERELRVAEDSLSALQVIADQVTKWNAGKTDNAAYFR